MGEAAAHPMRLSDEDVLRDRVAELAGELRAAAMKGDTVRITRLLSDLLQFRRLTRDWRSRDSRTSSTRCARSR